MNHKNSYHKSKKNLQAKIEDKEQIIRVKSMNNDALIYQKNIHDTLIYQKNINDIKLSAHHKFCIPHLCMHLSYACIQRWHDGSMHKRGTTVYMVLGDKIRYIFIIHIKATQSGQNHHIYFGSLICP